MKHLLTERDISIIKSIWNEKKAKKIICACSLLDCAEDSYTTGNYNIFHYKHTKEDKIMVEIRYERIVRR